MVYGQRLVNAELTSYATAKDVVAHEITEPRSFHTDGGGPAPATAGPIMRARSLPEWSRAIEPWR